VHRFIDTTRGGPACTTLAPVMRASASVMTLEGRTDPCKDLATAGVERLDGFVFGIR
jgi:hypothetical protein